ncbi:MAG: hypothetical protein PHC84_02180 [Clostridia bacterium]|nr:hypothetical protein [Clostridia bacterium]
MKKLIYSMFIILVVLALSMGLVACKEPDLTDKNGDETEETITRTQLVANGTFYNVANATGSKKYTKENVSGWDVTSGSLTKSTDGVVYGGIDLSDQALFERERKAFSINNTLAYPGIDPKTPAEKDDPDKLQDTNALLLASTKTAGSVYYKNSSDFTLKAKTYYKLQLSVLTDIDLTGVADADKAKKGAWIIIDGGVYAQFSSIATEGEWQTYEVYIEGSTYDAARTIKVRLWLGHGPATIKSADNVYSTKGAALFDNVICTEITKEQYAAAQDTTNIKKTTMLYPDMNLEQQSELSVTSSPDYFYSFRSGSNSSNNAVNYNLVEGKSGLTGNKPTVDKPLLGIVDMSKMYRYDATKEGDAKYINTYNTDHSKSTFIAPDRADFMSNDGIFRLTAEREAAAGGLPEYKALMIFHDDLSGAGFTSSKQLLVRKNTFYTIKVWVYVWATDLPTPPTSSVGTQPTAPTEARPSEEAVTTANAAMTVAEAEYNHKRISDNTITADILSQANRDAIEALGAERRNAIATGDDTAADYKVIYDDLKADYDELVDLKEDWEEYDDKSETYTEKYNDYMQKYWQWRDSNAVATGEDSYDLRPYAQFKVTGAGDLDPIKTDTTKIGEWQQLEFNINGNQLSDRKVNLEFWFGEGSSADYTTLMLGGALFDNITISESQTALAGKDYQELSPFTAEDELSGNVDIGGLIDTTGSIKFADDETLVEADLWEKELVSGVAQDDRELLSYSIVDDETYPINIGGVESFYNLLKMENTDYTAGILNFRSSKEILANKCYRLSLWAKTTDIDEKIGATLALMAKATDSADDMNSVSSFTTYNSEDWQELVFYIKGDTLKNNDISLKFTLGSGTRFDTSSYIKGSLLISAITMKEIKFSEYNASTKSGDQTKSYAFSNTASSSSDSVTNANFGSINLADIEEDAVNASGELVGVAPTSNWTLPSASSITTNGFNKPTLKIENIVIGDTSKPFLTWKHVEDANGAKPEGYEIYILNTIDVDEEDVDELYIGYVASADKYKTVGEGDAEEWHYRFEITSKAKGSFVVRGVSNTGVGTKSDTYANTVTAGQNVFTEYSVTPQKEYKIGTINYKTYEDGLYKNTMFADSTYVSPYSTMLMVESNYLLRANVTAVSKALNANAFYEMSVWVRTLNGAKASVGFEDISEALETRDEYIGYINQDTEGLWVQYRFYIATGAQSSNIELRLTMGNPYDKGTPGTETETTRMYGTDALSKGVIFFDNVQVRTLTEDEYGDKSAAKTADDHEGEYYVGNEVYLPFEMVYSNEFAYKVLSYTTDSFDSFTENTVTTEFDSSDKYNEGFYRGHTPNAYSWTKATDGATVDANRLYGVYSYLDINSNDHPLITNETNPDAFAAFLPQNFDLATFIRMSGYNSLVLSNLINNGQKYTLSNTKVLSSDTYYKLTFKAKTMLPAGTYAEFRYLYEGNNDEYSVIKLNTAGNEIDEYTEYTMYIYNEDDITKSVKWAFSLGGNAADEKIKGMLVIDDVKLSTSDAATYTDAKTVYDALSADAKKLSASQFHIYEEDSEPVVPPDTTDPEKDKDSIFNRGEIWLLISTIVIGLVIIATIVVVLVKKFKKKHPKKVKVENAVKTEKSIIVEPIKPTEKADVQNEEEFTDKEEKPKYVQRVLPKKKKK